MASVAVASWPLGVHASTAVDGSFKGPSTNRSPISCRQYVLRENVSQHLPCYEFPPATPQSEISQNSQNVQLSESGKGTSKEEDSAGAIYSAVSEVLLSASVDFGLVDNLRKDIVTLNGQINDFRDKLRLQVESALKGAVTLKKTTEGQSPSQAEAGKARRDEGSLEDRSDVSVWMKRHVQDGSKVEIVEHQVMKASDVEKNQLTMQKAEAVKTSEEDHSSSRSTASYSTPARSLVASSTLPVFESETVLMRQSASEVARMMTQAQEDTTPVAHRRAADWSESLSEDSYVDMTMYGKSLADLEQRESAYSDKPSQNGPKDAPKKPLRGIDLINHPSVTDLARQGTDFGQISEPPQQGEPSDTERDNSGTTSPPRHFYQSKTPLKTSGGKSKDSKTTKLPLTEEKRAFLRNCVTRAAQMILQRSKQKRRSLEEVNSPTETSHESSSGQPPVLKSQPDGSNAAKVCLSGSNSPPGKITTTRAEVPQEEGGYREDKSDVRGLPACAEGDIMHQNRAGTVAWDAARSQVPKRGTFDQGNEHQSDQGSPLSNLRQSQATAQPQEQNGNEIRYVGNDARVNHAERNHLIDGCSEKSAPLDIKQLYPSPNVSHSDQKTTSAEPKISTEGERNNIDRSAGILQKDPTTREGSSERPTSDVDRCQHGDSSRREGQPCCMFGYVLSNPSLQCSFLLGPQQPGLLGQWNRPGSSVETPGNVAPQTHFVHVSDRMKDLMGLEETRASSERKDRGNLKNASGVDRPTDLVTSNPPTQAKERYDRFSNGSNASIIGLNEGDRSYREQGYQNSREGFRTMPVDTMHSTQGGGDETSSIHLGKQERDNTRLNTKSSDDRCPLEMSSTSTLQSSFNNTRTSNDPDMRPSQIQATLGNLQQAQSACGSVPVMYMPLPVVQTYISSLPIVGYPFMAPSFQGVSLPPVENQCQKPQDPHPYHETSGSSHQRQWNPSSTMNPCVTPQSVPRTMSKENAITKGAAEATPQDDHNSQEFNRSPLLSRQSFAKEDLRTGESSPELPEDFRTRSIRASEDPFPPRRPCLLPRGLSESSHVAVLSALQQSTTDGSSSAVGRSKSLKGALQLSRAASMAGVAGLSVNIMGHLVKSLDPKKFLMNTIVKILNSFEDDVDRPNAQSFRSAREAASRSGGRDSGSVPAGAVSWSAGHVKSMERNFLAETLNLALGDEKSREASSKPTTSPEEGEPLSHLTSFPVPFPRSERAQPAVHFDTGNLRLVTSDPVFAAAAESYDLKQGHRRNGHADHAGHCMPTLGEIHGEHTNGRHVQPDSSSATHFDQKGPFPERSRSRLRSASSVPHSQNVLENTDPRPCYPYRDQPRRQGDGSVMQRCLSDCSCLGPQCSRRSPRTSSVRCHVDDGDSLRRAAIHNIRQKRVPEIRDYGNPTQSSGGMEGTRDFGSIEPQAAFGTRGGSNAWLEDGTRDYREESLVRENSSRDRHLKTNVANCQSSTQEDESVEIHRNTGEWVEEFQRENSLRRQQNCNGIRHGISLQEGAGRSVRCSKSPAADSLRRDNVRGSDSVPKKASSVPRIERLPNESKMDSHWEDSSKSGNVQLGEKAGPPITRRTTAGDAKNKQSMENYLCDPRSERRRRSKRRSRPSAKSRSRSSESSEDWDSSSSLNLLRSSSTSSNCDLTNVSDLDLPPRPSVEVASLTPLVFSV